VFNHSYSYINETGAREDLFTGLRLDDQAVHILEQRLHSLEIGPSREPLAPPPSSDEFSEEINEAIGAAEAWLNAIGRRLEPSHLDGAAARLNDFADIERRIVRGNGGSLERVRKVQANIKTMMHYALCKQATEKSRIALAGLSQMQKQEVVHALMKETGTVDDVPF
jgi:hypothetical protein